MNSTVKNVKMNACRKQMNSSSNVSTIPPTITRNSTPYASECDDSRAKNTNPMKAAITNAKAVASCKPCSVPNMVSSASWLRKFGWRQGV